LGFWNRRTPITLEQRAWHAARWKQTHLHANVTADRQQSCSAETDGTEPATPWRKPGRESVLQIYSHRPLDEKWSVAPYLGLLLISFSPSSCAGWHRGRRAACPTATMEIAPKKEKLGSSSLGFVILASG